MQSLDSFVINRALLVLRSLVIYHKNQREYCTVSLTSLLGK